MALRAMKAYPASQAQYPQLYAMVQELAEKANQPVPSIWIAPTNTPNAFATGRDPQHAAVCCTEGILQILGERELRAVLSHKLMHVYNRDILTSSVAAALGGLITSIAQFLMFFGGGRRDNDRGGIGVVATLAMALLAPLADAPSGARSQSTFRLPSLSLAFRTTHPPYDAPASRRTLRTTCQLAIRPPCDALASRPSGQAPPCLVASPSSPSRS